MQTSLRIKSIGRRDLIGFMSLGLLSLLLVVMVCPIVPGESYAEEFERTEVAEGAEKDNINNSDNMADEASSAFDPTKTNDSTNATNGEAHQEIQPENSTVEDFNSEAQLELAEVAAQTDTPTAQADEPSKISVSLDGNVVFSLTPDLEGNFVTASSALHIATDNKTGYKVYLSADHDGALVNSNSAITNVIAPATEVMNNANYKEHLNSWGYSLLNNTGEAEQASYMALPGLASDKEIINTEAAGADTYELGFAVAVGLDLPAGTYRNNVYVTVIANPVNVATWAGITYMQEMTSDICANIKDADGNSIPTSGVGESLEGTVFQGTLVDQRDETIYRVAKLKDGKCWMTQNLRIMNTTVTPENSDVSSNFTVPTSSLNFDESSRGRPKAYYANNESVGAYYNWYTATAGTGTTIVANYGQSASSSICPKGWRLPMNGVYSTLVNAYGAKASTIADAPLYFVRGGVVQTSGAPLEVGSVGYYWSATGYNVSSIYFLQIIRSSNLYPSRDDGYRERGFSVRCVAR